MVFSIIYVDSVKEYGREFKYNSNMSAIPEESYSITEDSKKDDKKRRIFVMGGTVWDWRKIKNKCENFQGCDMMIFDESTQVRVTQVWRLLLLINLILIFYTFTKMVLAIYYY